MSQFFNSLFFSSRKKKSTLLAAANKAKERLSRRGPTEEVLHRNLRGQVLQSGFLWERRYFVATENGLFVQEQPSSSEMGPISFSYTNAKIERIEG